MNVEALRSVVVIAHVGPPPVPANLWSSWTFDPLLLAAVGCAGLFYYRGLQRLWKRGAAKTVLRPWRAECFAAALAVILIALTSPLDALSSALFSAHMVQHILLIAVAAPLVVLGAPAAPLLVGLPHAWRRAFLREMRATRFRRPVRFIGQAPVAFVVATATLWLWHLPPLYELALRSQPIHASEHLLLLATALLFWVTVLPTSGAATAKRTARLFAGVASLSAMAVQGTVLGIAIAFSSQPWYPTYTLTSLAWGLRPTVDQQIAGLIMWIPAGAVYILAALFLLGFAMAGPSGIAETGAISAARSQTFDVVEG